jgi:hypothetical protein
MIGQRRWSIQEGKCFFYLPGERLKFRWTCFFDVFSFLIDTNYLKWLGGEGYSARLINTLEWNNLDCFYFFCHSLRSLYHKCRYRVRKGARDYVTDEEEGRLTETT